MIAKQIRRAMLPGAQSDRLGSFYAYDRAFAVAWIVDHSLYWDGRRRVVEFKRAIELDRPLLALVPMEVYFSHGFYPQGCWLRLGRQNAS